MAAENGSSKTDTLVKVVLVFFISLLSFSVGTFVGKQVSDSDHRRLALEGDSKAGRDIASTEGHGEAAGEDSEEKISEKEIENLTEEFVNKEKGADHGTEAGTHGQGQTTGHDEHAATSAPATTDAAGYKAFNRNKAAPAGEHKAANAGHDSHDVAEKVAAGAAPTDGKKEVRTPASTLPTVASSAVGKYTIQVASYIEEDEAKTRAAELKGKGWNAFYTPANVKGRTHFRVSVGLFDNVKSADEFRTQFVRDANAKGAFIQKVVQSL